LERLFLHDHRADSAARSGKFDAVDGSAAAIRKDTDRMGVKIRATIEFSVSDSGLEDALAEYDELTVGGLLREVLDKAIACDEIRIKIEEGPNTLEEFDQIDA
jgi:hypothetical protein